MASGKAIAGLYFKSIGVENVKCFGPRQVLDLTGPDGQPVPWTIILAENAGGKTTVLSSVWAMQLQEEYQEIRPGVHKRAPELKAMPNSALLGRQPFVRNGAAAAVLNAKYTLLDLTENQWSSWEGSAFVNIQQIPINLVSGQSIRPPKLGKFLVAPVFAYGAARRLSARESEEASPSTLIDENADLLDARSWITNLDHNALRGSENAQYRLAQVTRLLTMVLPNVNDLRVENPDDPRKSPRLVFQTAFGWLQLDQLSLGYQTMFAWMVDFVAGMIDAYPDAKNPLEMPAVCLVDEIDLHLHPTWQRQIVDHLSKHFPRTQFIVSAHSPLVVQSATDANVVLLRQPEGKDYVEIINDPPDVRNWRLDQILTSDLFGLPSARPKALDEPLAEREKILGKKKLNKKDRERLKELDALLADLPGGETVADSESMALIREAAQFMAKNKPAAE